MTSAVAVILFTLFNSLNLINSQKTSAPLAALRRSDLFRSSYCKNRSLRGRWTQHPAFASAVDCNDVRHAKRRHADRPLSQHHERGYLSIKSSPGPRGQCAVQKDGCPLSTPPAWRKHTRPAPGHVEQSVPARCCLNN